MVNMGTKSQSRLYMDKYKTQINWSSVLLKATVAASTLIKASSLSSSAYCSNGQLRPKSISGGGSSSIINTHSLSWNKPLHVPTKSAVKPLLMSTNNGKNSDKSERFRITYDQFDFDETFSFNMFQNELDSTKSDLPTVTDAYRNLETRQNDRPWFLTTAHIKELRVPELRKACLERDLSKVSFECNRVYNLANFQIANSNHIHGQAGKKEELQNRLIEWSTNEEARKSTLEKAGIVDYRVLPLQSARLKRNPGKNRMDRLSNLLASLEKDPTKLPKATDDEEDEDDDLFELTNSTSADEYLGLLTKTYHSSPHTPYSNLQLTQMYNDAKKADIKGDIKTAKRILVQLSKITPHDGRVVRRLARLHSSRGDYDSARKTLQNACRNYPENSHLWNGLAQIELKTNRPGLARQYFAEAISANPEFPNAYHALGRLEHQDGNIREALSILKKGIRYCPTNHRLHHALGSLYLEAKMLVPAEESLKKGMKCGPNWSQSFFCTSLAHAAYEMEGVQKAAEWLRKGVSLNPMHAQGWASLGELEESEDNFDAARKVYADAVEKYEEVRLKKGKTLRMGDKWRNVYMNWASMEERLGNISQAGEIYLKAAKVFPKDWNILTTFALTMVKSQGGLSHAGIKSIFGRACDIVGSRYDLNHYSLIDSTLFPTMSIP